MTDRKQEGTRPPDADRGREGFGDDGGTRVGRPDPAQGAGRHASPSTQPVKEGLEGAVFEGEGEEDDAHGRDPVPRSASSTDRGSTGAGAEAAEGTHGAQDDRASRKKGGSVDEGSSSTPGGADRRGSEPLAGRDDEHVSGYGGAGGQPKHSSDQREGKGSK